MLAPKGVSGLEVAARALAASAARSSAELVEEALASTGARATSAGFSDTFQNTTPISETIAIAALTLIGDTKNKPVRAVSTP